MNVNSFPYVPDNDTQQTEHPPYRILYAAERYRLWSKLRLPPEDHPGFDFLIRMNISPSLWAEGIQQFVEIQCELLLNEHALDKEAALTLIALGGGPDPGPLWPPNERRTFGKVVLCSEQELFNI